VGGGGGGGGMNCMAEPFGIVVVSQLAKHSEDKQCNAHIHV
jgi:hypothetical protein